MKKRIILVGRGGAGKDAACAMLTEKGYNKDVSATTRKARKGEVNGKDYVFASEDDFRQLILDGGLHEHKLFNGEMYGTLKGHWDKCNLFILTPEGVNALSNEDRDESFIVLLDLSERESVERMTRRGDETTAIVLRTKSDSSEFEGFTDYDLWIDSSVFLDEDNFISNLPPELAVATFDEVVQSALDAFGIKDQLFMLAEECAEVTQAASKLYRGKGGWEQLAEEYADLVIISSGVSKAAPSSFGIRVQHFLDVKTKRLKERVFTFNSEK